MKFDIYKFKDNQKRTLIATGLIAILLSFYTCFIIAIDFLIKKILKDKRYTNIFRAICAVGAFASILWFYYSDTGLGDLLVDYVQYFKSVLFLDFSYVFLIDQPFRWVIATTYGLYFSFCSNLLNEGMSEWKIQTKYDEIKKNLKKGIVDLANRAHMLIIGATRSGKGVLLNMIIKYSIVVGHILVILSAKLASTDSHSQLEYTRKMCKKYGKKLYVVSVDERVKDRCQYNPFKYVNREQLKNALNVMIKTDSHFYASNFTSWVLSIFDALKACKETVSMNNILDLYDYEDYKLFLSQKKNDGVISDETFEKLTSKKKAGYAEIAKNDAANLQLICDSCKAVFDETPNHKSITITDAIRKNAVIFFDMDGTSRADSTLMLGTCIMTELQSCFVRFGDSGKLFTAIADEASYMMSSVFKSAYNASASAGWKFVMATQGPSDFSEAQRDNVDSLLSQISNNIGQFFTLRLNSRTDAQIAADTIGTTISAEETHRARSISYDGMGSIKATREYIVHPDTIMNLNRLEGIYYEKLNDGEYQAKPVLVRLTYDDDEQSSPSKLQSIISYVRSIFNKVRILND